MMDGNEAPARDPRSILSRPYVIPTPIRRIPSERQLPAAAEAGQRRSPDPAAGTGLDPPAPPSPKRPPRASPTSLHVPQSGGSLEALASLFVSSPKPLIPSVTRQPYLPPKSEEEEMRHRREHEQMVETYKKKSDRVKAEKERQALRKEERRIRAKQFWTDEVFANWAKLKGSRKIHESCMLGLPPSLRGRVWPLALSNDLNITPELYSIFLGHATKAREGRGLGKEDTVNLIPLDLPRTFPALSFFAPEGTHHAALRRVLEAYVCYRPDVGYVQGMSFIAAIFLLYMEEYDTFCCMANLLNRPLFLSFYRMDVAAIDQSVRIIDRLLQEFLSELRDHFVASSIRMDMFMIDWVLTLFTKSLPLEISTRIWDVHFVDGDIVMYLSILGLLSQLQSLLLTLSFEGIIKTLSNLSQHLNEDDLFEQIESLSNNLSQSRFQEICKLCA